MDLAERIYEQASALPAAAAEEVLDFIAFLQAKQTRRPPGPEGENPAGGWDADVFLARFAGVLPEFPEIDDEGPAQEREPMA